MKTLKKNTKFICNEASAQVNTFDPSQFALTANQMRPFMNDDGEVCVQLDSGEMVVVNENAIQTNATLPYDAWKDIDRTVLQVATDRLVVVNDLINRGLTHSMGSIGQTVSQWDKGSDMTPAEISMGAEVQSEKDRQAFLQDSVAVPIVHKDFSINWRAREAARMTGESLDMTGVAIATRLVAEKSEDMVLNGSTVKVGTATVYGYTNHPDRNTVSLAANWDAITDYDDLIDDVIAMCDAARADNYYGPYTLYVPGNYEGTLDQTYKPGTDTGVTVRQRIMQIASIADIKIVDRLADDNVLLVQMSMEVVDLAVAQSIVAVDWTEDGTFRNNHRVFAAWAPRIKSDYDDRCGVVHLS